MFLYNTTVPPLTKRDKGKSPGDQIMQLVHKKGCAVHNMVKKI